MRQKHSKLFSLQFVGDVKTNRLKKNDEYIFMVFSILSSEPMMNQNVSPFLWEGTKTLKQKYIYHTFSSYSGVQEQNGNGWKFFPFVTVFLPIRFCFLTRTNEMRNVFFCFVFVFFSFRALSNRRWRCRRGRRGPRAATRSTGRRTAVRRRRRPRRCAAARSAPSRASKSRRYLPSVAFPRRSRSSGWFLIWNATDRSFVYLIRFENLIALHYSFFWVLCRRRCS